MSLIQQVASDERNTRAGAIRSYVPLVRKNSADKQSIAALKDLMLQLDKSAADVAADSEILARAESLLSQIKSKEGLLRRVNAADAAIPDFDAKTKQIVSDHEELLHKRSLDREGLIEQHASLNDEHNFAHDLIKQFNAILSQNPEVTFDYKPAAMADVD